MKAQAGKAGKGTGGQKPQGKLTYTPKTPGTRPARKTGSGSSIGGLSGITLDKYKQGQQKRNQAASRGKAQAKRAATKKGR
jgi:hypothetical protein